MSTELIGRLQSFLDRLTKDDYAGTKFEADADALRDAIAAIRANELMRRVNAPSIPQFPVMLRRMWSGGEVREWIDEHVNSVTGRPE